MSFVILSNVNNMAPRKGAKNVKTAKILDPQELVLNDVLCPICRSILIEPVTLPCNHAFCFLCFDGTMENANLVCPLCRIRIGSWLRKTKKESKLINNELWNAIRGKFPQQVQNKLNGIEENLEEAPEIVVSYPGEIRKEYELQKQKEDEEHRKRHEADIKASEELIRKIKEEDDYEQAVKEEKLKLDEEVARKLAAEITLSKSVINIKKIGKKVGPMDKFVKQENETITSQSVEKGPVNSFATKDYTCRVLCLESNKHLASNSHDKGYSPIVKKKIQQIQKLAETEITSDGSDCIESELRYFKPIDHRVNPPSEGKPPIKVPTRKPLKNTAANISSPTGLINFRSNFLESAFARISFKISHADTTTIDIYSTPQCATTIAVASSSKINHNVSILGARKSNKRRHSSDNNATEQESPSIGKKGPPTKRLHGKSNPEAKTERNTSPPFYGFEKSDSKNNNCTIVTNVKKNGIISSINEDDLSKKLLQEMADLEFAKKLQDEFNKNAHYTRSTTRRSTCNSRRQTTLDEIMTPYRVK